MQVYRDYRTQEQRMNKKITIEKVAWFVTALCLVGSGALLVAAYIVLQTY